MLVEFRERQGITTVLHVILQSVLDRHPTATREDIAQCLGEMDEAVLDSLRRLSCSFGSKFEPDAVIGPLLNPSTPTALSSTTILEQTTTFAATTTGQTWRDATMGEVRESIRLEPTRKPVAGVSPPSTTPGERHLQFVADAHSIPVGLDPSFRA